MARCRYCDTEITWLQEGRKKVPVENDGTVHRCENFKKARESFKQIDPSTLDPELVKQYEENINKPKKKR